MFTQTPSILRVLRALRGETGFFLYSAYLRGECCPPYLLSPENSVKLLQFGFPRVLCGDILRVLRGKISFFLYFAPLR